MKRKEQLSLKEFHNPECWLNRHACGGGGADPQLDGSVIKKSGFTLAEVFRPAEQSRKIAFTLAEVLITLGIIGVVAALTMPSLIAKYQMKDFETGIKKQYSVLQNTLDKIVSEDFLRECYIGTTVNNNGYLFVRDECNLIYQRIVSLLELNLVPEYDYEVYAKHNIVKNNGGLTVNGNCNIDDGIRNTYVYSTKDGALIFLHKRGAFISVDVNGKRGPNKWGYDVFLLTLSKHNASGKLFLSDQYCSLAEKDGRLLRHILRNDTVSKDRTWEWK